MAGQDLHNLKEKKTSPAMAVGGKWMCCALPPSHNSSEAKQLSSACLFIAVSRVWGSAAAGHTLGPQGFALLPSFFFKKLFSSGFDLICCSPGAQGNLPLVKAGLLLALASCTAEVFEV